MIMYFDTPDIAEHRLGNTGIDYVHTFTSARPGPHVCINALTHGNEICGAWAVDSLLRSKLRPACGSLSLSFANVAAFAQFSAANAEHARWVDEDFNRVWDLATLDGPRQSSELTRARELRGFFSSVDYLLDLHSMHTPGPALGLCGPTEGGLAFARKLGVPDYIVIDAGHSSGRRLRDFGDFGVPQSFRQALLLECGFHFDKASRTLAEAACARFLDATGVCPGLAPQPLDQPAPTAVAVTHAITIQSHAFRFIADWQSMQVINAAGTVIAYDGDTAITTPYDDCIMIMPAPERYRLPGLTAVRLGRRQA